MDMEVDLNYDVLEYYYDDYSFQANYFKKIYLLIFLINFLNDFQKKVYDYVDYASYWVEIVNYAKNLRIHCLVKAIT